MRTQEINQLIADRSLPNGDTPIFKIESGPWYIHVCPACMPEKLREPFITKGIEAKTHHIRVVGHSEFEPRKTFCALCQLDVSLGWDALEKIRQANRKVYRDFECPVCGEGEEFIGSFAARCPMNHEGDPTEAYDPNMVLLDDCEIGCGNMSCLYEGSQASFLGKTTVNDLTMFVWDQTGETPVVRERRKLIPGPAVEIPVEDPDNLCAAFEIVKCVKEALKRLGLFTRELELSLMYTTARYVTDKCIQILAPKTRLVLFELTNRYSNLTYCSECKTITGESTSCPLCQIETKMIGYTGIQGNLPCSEGSYVLHQATKVHDLEPEELPYRWMKFSKLGHAEFEDTDDVLNLIQKANVLIHASGREPIETPLIRHLIEDGTETIVFMDRNTMSPIYTFTRQ